jgi:SET domain-containing protein
MMCVKSKLAESSIHGIGVFAAENIKKGALIWKYDSRIDKVIPKKELEKLPAVAREFTTHYGYLTDGNYILAGDNGMFVNHSEKPNLIGEESPDGYGICRALRNIEAGEELTQDYSDFDENFTKRNIP